MSPHRIASGIVSSVSSSGRSVQHAVVLRRSARTVWVPPAATQSTASRSDASATQNPGTTEIIQDIPDGINVDR
jgi:hypothetical protein